MYALANAVKLLDFVRTDAVYFLAHLAEADSSLIMVVSWSQLAESSIDFSCKQQDWNLAASGAGAIWPTFFCLLNRLILFV